jgi:hypothetical protein
MRKISEAEIYHSWIGHEIVLDPEGVTFRPSYRMRNPAPSSMTIPMEETIELAHLLIAYYGPRQAALENDGSE